MIEFTDFPISIYDDGRSFVFPSDSVLLHSFLEERSDIPESWRNSVNARIEFTDSDGAFDWRSSWGAEGRLSPRRNSDFENIFDDISEKIIYIDYTGMNHNLWMPLVRYVTEKGLEYSCIYVEPKEYTIFDRPDPSEIFDLSEKIEGVSPVPTFTKLRKARGSQPVFVPFLGFEGTRFKHMIEVLQPAGNNVWPVIGVPGFQPEYPFNAYLGNVSGLQQSKAWENALYVDAACPFSLFMLLRNLQRENPKYFFQMGMIEPNLMRWAELCLHW